MIDGQITEHHLLTWIPVFGVLIFGVIAAHYVVMGWKWMRNRRNLSRYRCHQASRSPPRERPLDSNAPRLSTANSPSTSQGFRSAPEAAPPDRVPFPTSEESLRAEQEEARRISKEVRALSLPNWVGSAGNNAVGSGGRGGAGAIELRQVDEEALDVGSDDEGEEQQPGLGLGNVVANAARAVGGLVRLLGKPPKKVLSGGFRGNGLKVETNVEILGYNPRLAPDIHICLMHPYPTLICPDQLLNCALVSHTSNKRACKDYVKCFHYRAFYIISNKIAGHRI